MNAPDKQPIEVRGLELRDFDAVERLSKEVYPYDIPWDARFLSRHLEVFPEGQLAAIDRETGALAGYAATLIVDHTDIERMDSWDTVTQEGYFTTHNPEGDTLYAAEVIVDPACRGQGVGSAIYAARRELLERLGLQRIRAGARLRGYHVYQDELDPWRYVEKVVAGELNDPTLTFQLKQGFEVIGVVPHYLHIDPASLGHAALIEWRPDMEPKAQEL